MRTQSSDWETAHTFSLYLTQSAQAERLMFQFSTITKQGTRRPQPLSCMLCRRSLVRSAIIIIRQRMHSFPFSAPPNEREKELTTLLKGIL
jgi:hypothetical protein